jgi:hypothetical protein
MGTAATFSTDPITNWSSEAKIGLMTPDTLIQPP